MQVMKSLRSQTEGSEGIQKSATVGGHQSPRLGSQREDGCYWSGELGHPATLVDVSGESQSHAGDVSPAEMPREAEREGERYPGFSLLPALQSPANAAPQPNSPASLVTTICRDQFLCDQCREGGGMDLTHKQPPWEYGRTDTLLSNMELMNYGNSGPLL